MKINSHNAFSRNLDEFDLQAMREGAFMRRHEKSVNAPVKPAQKMARDPKSRKDRSKMVTIKS
jgi:hypothetical protein